MRVPLLTVAAAAISLMAVAAAAHGWSDNDERECPLPAQHAVHHHAGHGHHAAVRCPTTTAARTDEHVVRSYRIIHESSRDRDDEMAWRDRSHEDRDRAYEDRDSAREDFAWRREHMGDHDCEAFDGGDRWMHEDHGMRCHDESMRHDDGDGRWAHREQEEHWAGMHREQEERWSDRREHEERFVEERHMDHDCGCGPRRPTATDDEGFLVWPGKVAEGPAESWQAHP